MGQNGNFNNSLTKNSSNEIASVLRIFKKYFPFNECTLQFFGLLNFGKKFFAPLWKFI